MREPRAPPPSLPDVVEAGLGVREYWFETYRRVLVIPAPGGLLLSIDVYAPGAPGGEPSRRLEEEGVALAYYRLGGEALRRFSLRGCEPSLAEAVAVEVAGRSETVSLRLYYTCLGEAPSRDEVYQVYRSAVVMFEGRDPSREPLDGPRGDASPG